MKTTASQLKATARGHLTGRYAVLIIAYMISNLITNIPSLFVSYTANPYTSSGSLINTGASLILSFISVIFLVGQNRICLRYARGTDMVPVSEMWYGFKGNADKTIITYFLFFIRFLLYSVPFIGLLSCILIMGDTLLLVFLTVAALIFMLYMWIRLELDYALVFFLLIDYPTETPRKLLAHSKQLMKGNKGRLFYLQLSFIGMLLLVLLSFGIAMFWVYPYMRMTFTEFYLDLTSNRETVS